MVRRRNWTTRSKYRLISYLKDSWILFLSLFALLFVTSLIAQISLISLIILNVLFLCFFSKIRYKTNQNILVSFGKNCFIEKKILDEYFNRIIKKWEPVVKKERLFKIEHELSKLRFEIRYSGKDKKIDIFPHGNMIINYVDKFNTKEGRAAVHYYISKKIFPSFDKPFRMTVMRRFGII